VCGAHFGLPGPSVSSLASWGSDLAKYLFRLFPSESDREKAIQSSQQYRGHVQRLCVERSERHTAEQQRLESVCTQIRSALAVAHQSGVAVSEDDVTRNLVGIVTGSLGATMKLFSEGLALHLRSHPEARGKITWPSDRSEQTLYDAVIRPALAAGRRGGPDSLYRLRRSDNKVVVLWLGGAQEQTPDILFGSGAHRCPGSHIGRGIIEGVLRALSQCDGWFLGEGDDVHFEFT
jgi:cytochrome P450